MKNFPLGLLIFFMPILYITCQSSPTKSKKTEQPMDNFDLQGHRGARGLAPENTIPAFLKALEYNVTTLELDVVISKDSQIVVSHEPWFNHNICTQANGAKIDKANAKTFNIYQLNYQEIKAFDCGKIGHPSYPEQQKQPAHKPTLRMVVEAVTNQLITREKAPVYYNIETKSEVAHDGIFHPKPEVFVRLLYNELQELGILEYVTIQSFDVRTLEVLHQIDSSVTTALLVEHDDDATASFENDLKTLSFQPDIFSCNFDYLTKEMIQSAHDKDIKVIPWTVNKKADMIRLMDMGVDGLITDYPNRFRELK